ncbi:cytochrome P450 [Fusarium oxysporum II5]|uniref:Pisatin demethylase n=3 Tax=Fusarium oxysporum species complex TaxID=171631 RepID=N1S042_FUSC4|nr:uncharacterized protein FOIG_15953 [Fusarium odoratissimum NRRL 54006]EMT72228.1 Pisatin demethylase [Fusarium odoratissimum]EXL90850.1 hypothetical protein FOIG_15953 [Fusarium odoratissimum NRRL 54006]KAK2132163.1 cytochrome P450 [Fusarium oxysporum II5]TXC10518.1 hypothetical protein FocTR4_00006098 [Fusarium oxysporum f. sp. cubense]
MALLEQLNPTVVYTAAIAFLLFKFVIYPSLLSPLAKIPAARWHARFSPLFSWYIKYYKLENITVFTLHQKYGPIVRLGPKELSINCYEGGLKTVYTGDFPKTEFYPRSFSHYGLPNMIAHTDSNRHAVKRKMLSKVYSKSYALSSTTRRVTTLAVLFDRLVPFLQAKVDAQQPVEILKLSYAYSMDSFMTYQFGVSEGSNAILDESFLNWYLDNFFAPRPWAFWIIEQPNIAKFLSYFGIRLVPKKAADATNALEAWHLEVCDRSEKALQNSNDGDELEASDYPIVYSTVRSKHRELDAKSGYNAKEKQVYPRRLELASEMCDNVAAAFETSGNTITWLTYELCRRPEFQTRLRAELATLSQPIDDVDLSAASDAFPDFKDLDSLPFLDAILYETMRLWPAAPGFQPRQTPSGGAVLAGYHNIPGGVRVQASAYSLHRNKEVFPEPETWRPDRWLEATPDQLAEMRRWFWAFGSGSHTCLGNHLAMLSMKAAIATIYSRYHSVIYDAEGIEQDDGFVAGPKGQKLWVRLRPWDTPLCS